MGEHRERDFAHPVERELARVLDAHGIAWEYETRTFALEEEDGAVVEAVTPDFYLPELDMYLECTVMQQRHVSRKNRKLRKPRDRYGGLAGVLYRRGILRL